MNALVKKFAKDHFPDAKTTSSPASSSVALTLAKDAGHNAMVMSPCRVGCSCHRSKMRETDAAGEDHLYDGAPWGLSLREHLGRGYAADRACVLQNRRKDASSGSLFFRFARRWPGREALDGILANREKRLVRFEAAQDEFKKIPGSPVAYWVSESDARKCLKN